LKEIFQELKKVEVKKVGLEINQEKTKYMTLTMNKDKWLCKSSEVGTLVMKEQRPSSI
jgi:hypothetical protein